MGLTSTGFLVLLIALALAAPAGVVVLHRRAARTWWRTAGIGACVLLAQVFAVAAVAAGVNRSFDFYPTWSSIVEDPTAPPVAAPPPPPSTPASPTTPTTAARPRPGATPAPGGPTTTPATTATPTPAAVSALTAAPSASQYTVPALATVPGGGSYRQYRITGAVSGATEQVFAWLPPQYNDPAYAHTRFPVLLVLGGAYGPVTRVVSELGFDQSATAAIRSGKVAPFVAVFPELNIAGHTHDTECADAPGSWQAYTWLDRDVPDWARAQLRVSTAPGQWSAMGWSTGGYCAAKLHLRDPAQFAAAASVEGYFTPELDRSTGPLAADFAAQPALANVNSPLWLALHRPPAVTRLLVAGSPSDRGSYRDSTRFLSATAGVPGIQPYFVPGLGHNLKSWRAMTAPILTWLGAAVRL